MEAGSGAGQAHDVEVVVTEGALTPEQLAEWVVYQAAQARALALDAVERMNRKVAKAEAELDSARAALADAEGALAALEG